MKIKSNVTGLILLLVAGLVVPESVTGQTYRVTDASKLIINGTANVTDWDAQAKTIEGEVRLENTSDNWEDADASWFKYVKISIPVTDIDADSRRMNRNMHDYLEADSHPNITYELKESVNLVLADNPGAVLTARGVVSAAGVSKEIEHEVHISLMDNGNLKITGSQDLIMSDFGIDPPTAVLGTVRARDEMTISFELILEK